MKTNHEDHASYKINGNISVITGVIQRIIFFDFEKGFFIADVLLDDGSHLVVRGNDKGVAPGINIRATGVYREHSRFGRQFYAHTVMALPPETKEGILCYLSSGFISGIGKKTAERLVTFFGDGIREALDQGEKRLQECPGIGKAKAYAIATKWEQDKVRRDTFVLLSSFGLTKGQILRLMKIFGAEAPYRVKKNPYEMIGEVPGVGFRTADAIAEKMGIDPLSSSRIEAAIKYVLFDASQSGHLFLPEDILVDRCKELTGVDGERIKDVVKDLVERDILIQDESHKQCVIWEKGLFTIETRVAQRIATLLHQKVEPLKVYKDLITNLSPSQAAGLTILLREPFSILTGGPGTGKTTIISTLCKIAEMAGLKVALAAPTGRAAMRIRETTGRDAKTIHRLLEYNPSTNNFNRNMLYPIDVDWVIVDEASMLDIRLADNLLDAISPKTRLTLVGDADQIPPVGPGDPFRDLIRSKSVPVACLTEVFRQEKNSLIIENAHRILRGLSPISFKGNRTTTGDFYVIHSEDAQKITNLVERLVIERIPQRLGFDPSSQIQVLSPMHKGDCGTKAINMAVRTRLNRTSESFYIGDRVIQNRNNYEKEVFNGDIGVVVSMDGGLRVRFEDREVLFDESDMEDLDFAYAITMHKAQGSEFDAVVVVLHTQHYMMLRRNLLYTGITRGKRLVILVGSPKAIRYAVENAFVEDRNTALAEKLGAFMLSSKRDWYNKS